MIVYFDTSAIVPLVIAEPSSPRCLRLWESADMALTSLLAYVEMHAAIAQAERMRRLDPSAADQVRVEFELIWREFTVVTPVEKLITQAAILAREHSLRGYDAVHCASVCAVYRPDLVAATSDQRLLRAWYDLGMATADTLL